MTPQELENALDKTLRGDQGAAQRIIDHNKALLFTSSQALVALTDSQEALRAWMHAYAPYLCNDEDVVKYTELIAERGGTLAYIARVFKANKAAIALVEGKTT